MSFALGKILELVGRLDDAPGADAPRQRFRKFLNDNITEVGQIRDYIEECLRKSGEQYNRALQDLVNHVGGFLGFEVEFGRYQGVQGQIGFDGLWKSLTGLHVVIEAKTTEVYAIKTSPLVGYIDQLISDRRIPNWDAALGLYVIGRPDPESRHLEKTITAEKRTAQLRIISVESLLSLAEMMNEYDVSHKDILAVLRPSGPSVDDVVDVMARLVAQTEVEETAEVPTAAPAQVAEGEIAYWLTPVKSGEEHTAEEIIETLVGQERVYAFSERTPGRKHIKPGDWICFYATGNGVIAHAKVASRPERKSHPKVGHPEMYPWVFELVDAKVYLDTPIVIDASMRARLEA
ncbi:MAG: hypothetical protein V3R29_07540, partial [Candidatus Acidoferrales bacterium]